jgi:nucleoside-diphosphate-sugar epimerase
MRFLITGAAGFIGYHVSRKLMEMGYSVIGVDNESDYYSPELKQARVQELMKLAESSGTVGKFEYVVAISPMTSTWSGSSNVIPGSTECVTWQPRPA